MASTKWRCWLFCFTAYQLFSDNLTPNQVILIKVCMFKDLRDFKQFNFVQFFVYTLLNVKTVLFHTI